MEVGGLKAADRHVEGVVEMMLDATRKYDEPLTVERLLAWHASLFPTGRTGMRKIRVGAWRDDKTGPMQVVSGPAGREYVHYEAPAAARLTSEMQTFLDWFNRADDTDPVLRAALAHLWFVTIHPFDYGNGRIARAIADWALARSENSPQRFYSLSAQIRQERNDYYTSLERTQKGTLDITEWMAWFLNCLDRAIEGTETTLAAAYGSLAKPELAEKALTAALNADPNHVPALIQRARQKAAAPGGPQTSQENRYHSFHCGLITFAPPAAALTINSP